MNSGPRRSCSWPGAIHGRAGSGGIISGARAAGASPSSRDKYLPLSFMFCAQGASGRRCRRALGVAVPFMPISSGGAATDFSYGSGKRVWRNTTNWKGLPGRGRVSTAPWAKRPSPRKLTSLDRPAPPAVRAVAPQAPQPVGLDTTPDGAQAEEDAGRAACRWVIGKCSLVIFVCC